jgi:N-acetylmuramoyl-L-alanine amidase
MGATSGESVGEDAWDDHATPLPVTSGGPGDGLLIGRRRWTSRLAWIAGGALFTGPLGLQDVSAARFSNVILDPGHGGRDNGAKWGGVAEKHLALDVAKRVHRLLSAKRVNSVLTRTRDSTVELTTRAAKANRYRNAVFVSIHFNAHWKRNIYGVETHYMSTSGRALASRVQGRMISKLRTRNRGLIRNPGLAVLNKTRCTAVLVECGFLSNTRERGLCCKPSYRQRVAEAIAEGIVTYR